MSFRLPSGSVSMSLLLAETDFFFINSYSWSSAALRRMPNAELLTAASIRLFALRIARRIIYMYASWRGDAEEGRRVAKCMIKAQERGGLRAEITSNGKDFREKKKKSRAKVLRLE